MRNFYYKTKEDAVGSDEDDSSPLQYIVYLSEEDKDYDTMFCWCYDEDSAKYIVNALNNYELITN